MELLNEIREYFATGNYGVRELKTLKNGYHGAVIRTEDWYGVGIKYDELLDVSESFTNCTLDTKILTIENASEKYLILSCNVERLRNEFATVCIQFIDPGVEGEDRMKLIDDPISWWMRWRDLLGNAIENITPYSVLAEMLALENLYSKDKTIEWSAAISGSHDIEGEGASYEVKSTLQRYESNITISGQHQLKSTKRLSLYFCRLEKSLAGISINDMRDRIITLGYDEPTLESQLSTMGFNKAASVRNEKYKILETRKYEVDEKFPKITEDSFKDECIPKAISKITYTVGLDGLEYTCW